MSLYNVTANVNRSSVNMRIGLALSVLVCTLLLALPETWGAPCNDDCADQVDQGQTICETNEKAKSKNTEKTTTVDKEQTKKQAKASNGLVSGSASISLSRSTKDQDEEKSHSKDQKTTTTGEKESTESTSKKKLVSVDESKKVLIYYMVSYKKLPARGKDEELTTYYMRVFPEEENLYVFYRKVFKSYEGEKPTTYITRVEYIWDNVYPELDCRLNMTYLELWDHYYTIKYSRKVDETDDHYYPRVLAKLTGESCEHYKLRMKCLVAALDEEDFSHITFDDSAIGYTIGVKKTPTKKPTQSDSCDDGSTPRAKSTSSTKKSKEEEVDLDQDECSKKEKTAQGTTSETEKSLKKKKTTIEKEQNVKTFEYRVAYTKLPKKTPGELDEVYYKRFFGEFSTSMSETERNEMYLRILIQYKGENITEYVQRIDFLFDKCYPQMDIRTNRVIIGLLEHYYRVKYEKKTGESEDEWFARVVSKLPNETAQHYEDRVYCLESVFTEVKWDRIKIDSSSAKGYSLVNCG